MKHIKSLKQKNEDGTFTEYPIGIVTGVKGSSEEKYRVGDINITKDDIGLNKVENTADEDKVVKQAGQVANALTVGNKTYNGSSTVTVEKSDVVKVFGYEPPVNDTQGVNLLRGTRDFSGLTIYDKVIFDTYNGFTVIRLNGTASDGRIDAEQRGIKIEKYGETYTGSFFAKGTGILAVYFYGELNNYAGIDKTLTSTGVSSSSIDGKATFTVSDEWKQYWVQWTLRNDGNLNADKYLLFRIEGINDISIYAPKLEHGAVNNPIWTPAPEDLVTGVNGVHGDVEIGGTQLLHRTDDPLIESTNYDTYNYRHWGWQYDSANTNSIKPIIVNISDSPVAVINKAISITNTSSNNNWNGVGYRNGKNNNYEILPNVYYTFSVYVKGICSRFSIQFDKHTDSGNIHEHTDFQINSPNNWKRVSALVICTDKQPLSAISLYTYGPDDSILICGMKLERGNVATDWSPCPEDLLMRGDADGRNLFKIDRNIFNVWKFINEHNVMVNRNNSECTSEYISVTPGEAIIMRLEVTAPNNITDWAYWSCALWYNSKKEYISSEEYKKGINDSAKIIRYDISKTFISPKDAAYLRISFRSYKNTRIKIERGSVVTDWTPPVDDPLVSGGVETRNLLLNTMQPITSTASSDNVYAYTDYQYSEETIPIGVYTFSANIDVLNGSFDTVSIVPFSAELSNAQMGGEKVDCKIYEHRVIAILEITKEVATRITVYTGIMGSTQGNSMRISNAKLEKGVNLNPRWSPAPEDIAIRVKDDHILIIGAN